MPHFFRYELCGFLVDHLVDSDHFPHLHHGFDDFSGFYRHFIGKFRHGDGFTDHNITVYGLDRFGKGLLQSTTFLTLFTFATFAVFLITTIGFTFGFRTFFFTTAFFRFHYFIFATTAIFIPTFFFIFRFQRVTGSKTIIRIIFGATAVIAVTHRITQRFFRRFARLFFRFLTG